MAKDTTSNSTGMMFNISLFLVAVVNLVVFYLANMFFPENIVLGTISLTASWALILTSTALSLITVIMMPFLRMWEMNQKRDMKPAEMIGVYFVINFVGLWLLTRASDVFGLGVTSWIVVLLLAVVLDFAQGMVMMQVDQMRKK